YALYARQDRYLTVQGTGKLEEMSYLPCSCPVCQKHTLKELMASPDKTRLLARHNLYVSLQEIKQVKESIREGSLWDLLEVRCRSHPRMLDGLRRLASKAEWLERLDTARKSTFFCTSAEGSLRPEVMRYARRIDRISLQGNVLITDDSHMDTRGYDRVLYWKPPFGPYPAELAETYPFNAEVPEEADSSALGQADEILQELIHNNPDARFCIRLKQKQQSI
ncbi:MAG TPA: tRNA-guanine transglycosylase, partial [Methanothrix sp.]|nr:tRNA-guanine transglycosylase [Methanothrix sp.]